MKATEAKKIATQNRDITDYVEKEVSADVESAAKDGDFRTKVYVNKPDWYDDYSGFREKAKDALIRLGYKVEQENGHGGGFSFIISWMEAK